MEAVSLWSLQKGHLVVPENLPRAEGLLQEVVVASTVVLMDIGLEIALLVTGRINVIDVEIEVTSRETARTVLRSSVGTKVTQDRQFGPGLGLLVAEEEALAEAEAEAEAEATAVAVAIVDRDHRLGRKRIEVLKLEEAEALNQWLTTLLLPKIGSEA
jgi:hypothetical protein